MTLIVRRIGWLALVALLCGVAFERPHVVDRYALYLGSPSKPQLARLYLDPFPDAVSCESRVRLFRANAEAAFCSAHRELALGGRADALLAADFSPLALGAYCKPRRSSPRIARAAL